MRFLMLIALLVGLLAWRAGYFSGPVDPSVLVGSGPDECARAEKCLAVYLTPSSPECRRSGELVNELRSRAAISPHFGFKVIIGGDDQETLSKYASRIGGAVYFDYDGEFHDQIGVGDVPAWVTWNAAGRILDRMSGRPKGAPAHVLVDQMSEKLDLGDVL
jgi:hypothetical protein